MLTRIDRIQVATPDIGTAASRWGILLGAEHDGDDVVSALAARRSRYRVGDGWVEFLEPDGAGPVADALAERGGAHLFAAGAATVDVDELVLRFVERGQKVAVEGGQAFLDADATGGYGLRLVVSAEDDLPSVGAIDYLYEVTNLVANADAAVAEYADGFGFHPSSEMVPIESKEYGYRGFLTLFHPDRLHRFEVINPHDRDKTMGRYFGKFGESLYMCFAESNQLASVAERCKEAEAPITEVGNHTLFLHPAALGGVMVGLSRPTYAWTWSGHPERVETT
ncbi:MAG TPA: hypothetical protein VFB78_00405 [Acidimicrobiales bacterium]|nr:hypothetical protein [Acidimicrobiales bacterium]